MHHVETLLPHRRPDAEEAFPAAEAVDDAGEDFEPPCDWEAYNTRLRQQTEQRAKDNYFDKGEGELACVSGGTVNTHVFI